MFTGFFEFKGYSTKVRFFDVIIHSSREKPRRVLQLDTWTMYLLTEDGVGELTARVVLSHHQEPHRCGPDTPRAGIS